MRTTIRLRGELLRRAKKRAAEEDRTLTSLIEEGVTLVLARAPKRARVDLPVGRAGGGLQPGVDINRSSDIEAVMEDA